MRWRCKVASGLLAGALLVSGPRLAAADLWDTLTERSVTASQVDITRGDQTGLTWRGGPQLHLPSGRGGQVFRVEAGAGGGCGLTNFVAEFKAMFNAQATPRPSNPTSRA